MKHSKAISITILTLIQVAVGLVPLASPDQIADAAYSSNPWWRIGNVVPYSTNGDKVGLGSTIPSGVNAGRTPTNFWNDGVYVPSPHRWFWGDEADVYDPATVNYNGRSVRNCGYAPDLLNVWVQGPDNGYVETMPDGTTVRWGNLSFNQGAGCEVQRVDGSWTARASDRSPWYITRHFYNLNAQPYMNHGRMRITIPSLLFGGWGAHGMGVTLKRDDDDNFNSSAGERALFQIWADGGSTNGVRVTLQGETLWHLCRSCDPAGAWQRPVSAVILVDINAGTYTVNFSYQPTAGSWTTVSATRAFAAGYEPKSLYWHLGNDAVQAGADVWTGFLLAGIVHEQEGYQFSGYARVDGTNAPLANVPITVNWYEGVSTYGPGWTVRTNASGYWQFTADRLIRPQYEWYMTGGAATGYTLSRATAEAPGLIWNGNQPYYVNYPSGAYSNNNFYYACGTPYIYIDTPATDSTISAGPTSISGWAARVPTSSGTGVSRVDIYVDGVLQGAAAYGAWRQDIANLFGNNQYGPSGYWFNWNATVGARTIRAVAISSGGCPSWETSNTVTVVAPTATPTTTSTRTPTNTPTSTNTPTRTPTKTPTPTPTSTPTWTPTATPTATPTNTPAPTATPALQLYRQYPWLLWYAANVGLPAQVLTGTLTRAGTPLPGDVIRLRTSSPSGTVAEYWVFTDVGGVFQLDATTAGDVNFGSTEQGTWDGQAFYDVGGQSSNRVDWEVEWFIIHLIE